MKPIKFDWDEGNLGHTGKHGLTPSEVEHVLGGGTMVAPDPFPSEARWKAIGQTEEDRFALIVFTLREIAGTLHMRPISARYMHRKEIEKYERQRPKE